MAKDNGEDNSNLSTPASSGSNKRALRSKPYDANNSFVKKVATKVTDFFPQKSWISKWFNNSQDEQDLHAEIGNQEDDMYEDKQSQPPPIKRPCIRMDVTHPPGTFSIQPRNRNVTNDIDITKDRFSNNNDTTHDFSEPTTSGARLDRFVSSTPAFPINSTKVADHRSALNMLMSEQTSNGAANGADDNSESSESTSGCSSLIPQNNRQEAPANANYNSPFGSKRRFIEEKLSFTNHLQSPKSLFLDANSRETLASRRPSFNPQVMSNTLGRNSSLTSPFYPGNTMFGGSNAANLYSKSSNSILSETSMIQQRVPQRASVEVKPSNNESTKITAGMSQTARRILETLEHFSSPLSDVKKIPVRMNLSGNNHSPALAGSRKRLREDETSSPKVGLRHLTRELTVPTVPDILRLRRQQRIQNTTINARKIMSSINKPTVSATQNYHIRTEADVEPQRNQLKAKKKTKLEEEETVESVDLPTMPLPISNLPRFDISLPQFTKPAAENKMLSRPVPTQQQMQQGDQQSQLQPFNKVSKDDSFHFASPIKLLDGNKNLESINNFTFSKPITPSKMATNLSMNDSQELSKTTSIDSTASLSTTSSFPNFMFTGPSSTTPKLKEKPKQKDDNEEVFGGIKVASELKEGSVMDFFKKQAAIVSSTTTTPITPVVDTTDSEDVWECSDCLIKNNGKKTHCVACRSARPASDSSSDIEVLEISSDDDDCIVIPEPEEETSKSTITRSTPTKLTSSSSINALPHFGSIQSSPKSTLFNSTSKFDLEKSKIETPTTTNDKLTTASSTFTTLETSVTSSPSLNAFKAAKSSWECPCCMVQNADTVSTCPCCNTAKPGSVTISPKQTTVSSSLVTSTVTTTITSGFGDKFKTPEGSWTCDVCMISNKSDIAKCAACETPKPGVSTSSTPAASITPSAVSGFGDKFKKPEGSWTCESCMLSNKSDDIKCIACEAAKPGTEKSTSNLQFKVDMPANASGFKFGIDKAEDSEKAVTTTLPKTNGFNFGSTSTTSAGFSFGTDTAKTSGGFNFKPSESVAAAATFQFGTKPLESPKRKDEEKSTTPATFSFGAPVKSDAPTSTTSTGFLFGASSGTTNMNDKKKDEEKKQESSIVSTGFTFGAQATTAAQTPKEPATEISKSVTKVPATSNFLFGSPKPSISSTETKKDENISTITETPKPSLPFGTPASTEQKSAATAMFSFGSNAAATTLSTSSTQNTSLFTFKGAQQKTAETSVSSVTLPAFGSTVAPKPTFSFGKPAESLTTQENENKSTLGSRFGNQANQTSSLFSGINTTPKPTLNATTENKSLFGGPENKSASTFGDANTKMSAFRASTDNKSATSAFPSSTSTAAFGTSAPTPTSVADSPFGSTGSVFGSTATPSFGSGTVPTTNMFSATSKPNETPAASSGLFSFGQTPQASSPSTGGFNFSTTSNTTSTSNDQQNKSLFSFGASNTSTSVGNGFSSNTFGSPAPAATSSFSFNAPKPDAPTSTFATTSTSMFNAPSGQPPAYPGTNTSGSAPVSGGFNFGNTNMPNSFNFGNTTTPASGGFNFNAPGSTAAPPAFDPNATPTFNFTAGSNAPTAFNAPPAVATPTTLGGRKIKKAVRRMPRQ